ncbi:glycosyltransferase family 2 protein [Dactylosporangium sp. CA-233914]|uniref:glycosyltransferase family 2 protein n=1 Tax=Dactylosporangium sp. CA-233914 TaxID=3239934 RepID=UPI003D8CE9D5
MSDPMSVSVVIPCYSERRWDQLVAAVASAWAQQPRPERVVVVVDHNDALLARAAHELPEGTVVVANESQRGASGARNTGVRHTTSPVIALLDDDATARPGWLAGLLAPFADPAVVGTGGAIAPAWEQGRPRWFPDEFLWVVGASYRGMPTGPARVRNVWSESMAVRRDAFLAVGGFRVGFGKVGERARPEDTDLCLRMGADGGAWVYNPASVIDHLVPAARSTLRFFVARSANEGRGKIELARLNLGRESLGSEQDYARELPRAAVRSLLRGDLGQAFALVAGAGAAAAGAGYEWAFGARRHQAPQPAVDPA